MNTVRILLVEDESIIALDVKNILTSLGYEVIAIVATGEEAVRRVAELTPDLVLMDIILAGDMDGIEAARILRSTQDIPVVFMTAHADVATVCRARDTAPYGYILKPINQADIFSTIDAAMNRHCLEQELRDRNMQLNALNEEFEAANEELEASNEELQAINEELISSQEEIREANIRARISEEKYRTLVESANSIIMRWNREGYISFINEYGLNIFGFSEEELLGHKITDTIISPVENLDGTSVTLQDIFDNTNDFRVNVNEIIRKNGDHVWISWTNRALYNENGMIEEVLSIGNDITPLKETERELEETRLQYEKLVTNIPVGVYRFRTTADGKMKFEYASPRFCQLIGLSADIVYRNHDSVFRLVHPDEYDELLRLNIEAAQTGCQFVWEGRMYPNGVERWMRIESSPTVLDNGDILWDGIQIDVTERRLADNALQKKNSELEILNDRLDATVKALETANLDIASANEEMIQTQRELTESIAMLRRSEERFHKAFYTNPTAMTISVLEDGTYVEVNDAALEYGNYTREELIGARIGDLGIYSTEKLSQMKGQLLENGMLHNYTIQFRRKDGEVRDGLLSAEIIDLDGVKHVISSTVDITEKNRAEVELERVNTLFSGIFNLAPELMSVSTLDDGRFFMINDAFSNILGYSREEAIGRTSHDLNLWIAPAGRSELINEFGDDGVIHNIEVVFRRKNGEPVDMLFSAVFIEMNNTPCILTIAADISSIKKTENALRENEEKYRTLFESAYDAIFIADTTATFIDCNSKTEEIYGITREEIIGRTPMDLSPPFQADGVSSEEKAMMYVNMAFSGLPQVFEWVHLRGDGSRFDAEVSLNKMEIGSEELLMAVVRDVTDRKQAENAVRESETLYRAIFENTGNATIIIEEDTTIVLANSQWEIMSGYRKEELEGKMSWTGFVVPGDLVRMKEYHKTRRTVPDDAPWMYEFQYITRDGEVRDVINHVAMIPGTKKSIASLLDITERKRAETALKKSLQEKEVLIKEIHHRVKNNLQVISSLLGLQSDSIKDSALKEAFMESRNRIRGMAHIHEMLYQSENFDSIDFSVYVKRVVKELIKNYSPQERTVEIRYNLSPVMIGIDMAIPLGIIMNELVTNAMKYAFREQEKGILEIGLRLSEGVGGDTVQRVHLEVRDNGTGFAPEFDSDLPGSLGLTMVRLLSERQLGGSFKLESSNAGTLVFIEIPLHHS
ncbi:MAG TPA: PAS domain S-box protein [Spirochaetota bacterium]|nr:PAS domain S-box protein [Spirochaetota bacterium]